MNSLTILTVATVLALAASARYFYLDSARERRRTARLTARIDELLDVLDEDVTVITDLRRQLAQERHPAGKDVARSFTVIQGGAS